MPPTFLPPLTDSARRAADDAAHRAVMLQLRPLRTLADFTPEQLAALEAKLNARFPAETREQRDLARRLSLEDKLLTL